MTNAVQRQDKQTFADSFSANKYRPPYTIVALIPAGFSRPIPAFNQCPRSRPLANLHARLADLCKASPYNGSASLLRCRSHWPSWYKYPLFIPLRPFLSPCPCHCAVILSEISSLQAGRPIDIENPVFLSPYLLYTSQCLCSSQLQFDNTTEG
jgi:hypothetical protein